MKHRIPNFRILITANTPNDIKNLTIISIFANIHYISIFRKISFITTVLLRLRGWVAKKKSKKIEQFTPCTIFSDDRIHEGAPGSNFYAKEKLLSGRRPPKYLHIHILLEIFIQSLG